MKEAWYCQYGDKRAKLTNIWTNLNIKFKTCFNGNKVCHHEPAPRGSKIGTQGIKGNADRSKIPAGIFEHILQVYEEGQTKLNKYALLQKNTKEEDGSG